MQPSDFFKNAKFNEEYVSPKLRTWEVLYEKELKLLMTHPPANGFEQLIRWTQQGKLWHFPINNEQGWIDLFYIFIPIYTYDLLLYLNLGLEEEAQIGFHEHVFLDHHLQPWCPKRGPVRNFMELVTVGLSKNPYLTVAKKKEHIFWYRDFFDAQRSILIETGAIVEASKSPNKRPSLSA